MKLRWKLTLAFVEHPDARTELDRPRLSFCPGWEWGGWRTLSATLSWASREWVLSLQKGWF